MSYIFQGKKFSKESKYSMLLLLEGHAQVCPVEFKVTACLIYKEVRFFFQFNAQKFALQINEISSTWIVEVFYHQYLQKELIHLLDFLQINNH